MTERTSLQVVAAPAASVPLVQSVLRRSPALPASHSLREVSVIPPVRVQAELEIGEPDDPLEREADDVADAVMRMPDPQATPVLQRTCAECENEETLQAKLDAPGVVQSDAGGLVASGSTAERVAAARSAGAPLSEAERTFFEPRLRHDLSAVRVHSGPESAAAAAEVGARAFAVGSDIVLGAGQPDRATGEGQRLLAHELTHVIQQGHAPALEAPEGGES